MHRRERHPDEEAGKGLGATKPETAEVSELQPNAEYTVCFITANAFGSEVGSEERFKTLPAAPKVDGESVSAIKPTGVSLEAQVNPNNEHTTGSLQYSTSATVNETTGSLQDATTTTSSGLGEGFGDQPVTPPAVTGLTAGETYYYQAVATNAAGTTYGPVQEFTTASAPMVVAESERVSSASPVEATFAATIDPDGEETTYEFEYAVEGSTVTKR